MRPTWPILVAAALACAPAHAAKPSRREASQTRWYGAEPHTPLAITDRNGLRTAGQPMCAPWSQLRSRWRAIDSYGQVVGHAELSARDRYDVTRCEEVAMTRVDGADGVGLFASQAGPWRPAATLAWTPDAAERASLARLVEGLQSMVDASGAPAAAPLLFFRTPASASRPSAGHVVIGGDVLVVATLEPGGRWRLDYFENAIAARGRARTSFRPLAVFDMDGDGWPEVVFHMSFGDSWSDVVLHSDSDDAWRQAAESVHGASA
jgi:hypothetical protein